MMDRQLADKTSLWAVKLWTGELMD